MRRSLTLQTSKGDKVRIVLENWGSGIDGTMRRWTLGDGYWQCMDSGEIAHASKADGSTRPSARKLASATMPKTRVRILTVSELAEYLRVDKTTIYRALKEGKLPGFRVGSDWRFHLDAIEQWQRGHQMKDNARKPD